MSIEKKIYYHDTDAGGVVYYGNYLKYLEEARTAFLEDKGLSVRELWQEHHFLYAVRKCLIEYKSPARYGDSILCDAVLKKITAAQIVFDQRIFNSLTKILLVEAEVTLVSLDNNFKPTPIPENIKTALSS